LILHAKAVDVFSSRRRCLPPQHQKEAGIGHYLLSKQFHMRIDHVVRTVIVAYMRDGGVVRCSSSQALTRHFATVAQVVQYLLNMYLDHFQRTG
jgi:hypothetical protein